MGTGTLLPRENKTAPAPPCKGKRQFRRARHEVCWCIVILRHCNVTVSRAVRVTIRVVSLAVGTGDAQPVRFVPAPNCTK